MSDKDDLKQQMAQFEAARIARPANLAPARIGQVVAVHDGTDQDVTVDALARAIAVRCGARQVTLSPPSGPGVDPLPAMLEAAGEGDVIVVPSPFGRDYRAEGQLSLSTTIDLLLATSKAAVCVARGPLVDAAQCVSRPMVGLQVDRHRKVVATALALALAMDGGEILLLSSVDPQTAIEDEELLARKFDPRDLSPEILTGLASARAAALTADLQKHAGEWHVEPRVQFAIGDTVELLLEANEERDGLLVVGRDRDARSPEAQRAHRLILSSRWPVLLV